MSWGDTIKGFQGFLWHGGHGAFYMDSLYVDIVCKLSKVHYRNLAFPHCGTYVIRYTAPGICGSKMDQLKTCATTFSAKARVWPKQLEKSYFQQKTPQFGFDLRNARLNKNLIKVQNDIKSDMTIKWLWNILCWTVVLQCSEWQNLYNKLK